MTGPTCSPWRQAQQSEGLFAAAFTVFAFLPALAANGLLLGRFPAYRAGPFVVLLTLTQCLPLAFTGHSRPPPMSG